MLKLHLHDKDIQKNGISQYISKKYSGLKTNSGFNIKLI